MTEVKLCPLRKINGKTFDHCYREKCAWYDEELQECVILTLKDKIAALIAAIRKDLVVNVS